MQAGCRIAAIGRPGGQNGQVPTYKERAVVLRQHNLGEADRIVTLLTQDNGLVRAVAKGVRKSTSRYGARLDPLNLVELQLSISSNQQHNHSALQTVGQVETISAFGSVATSDYAIWSVGQAMAETAEKIVGEEPAYQQFVLLVGGLRALTEQSHDAGLVADAYTLRAMSVAGWGASFDECARCSAPGPHRWFSISSGGAHCADCRMPGCATPSAEAMQLMGALLAGDWETAEAIEGKARSEVTGIVNASLQWQLEREVKAIKHVDRTLKGEVRAK